LRSPKDFLYSGRDNSKAEITTTIPSGTADSNQKAENIFDKATLVGISMTKEKEIINEIAPISGKTKITKDLWK